MSDASDSPSASDSAAISVARSESMLRGPAGAAEGLLDRADLQWILRPISGAYAVGRWAHHALYASGVLRRERLARPTICVGGLTVGGVGKTPFLIGLARELGARGLRPAVLSRGYGSAPPAREPRVVSDGLGSRIAVEASGDEPALIARSLPGAPVVIGSGRAAAGRLAEARFDPDLFLLDDGFQHEPLARDADLVLWDARDLPSRMRQLPAGRLREGLRGLRRASAIILTHAEYIPEADRAEAVSRDLRELKTIAPELPIFEFAAEFTGAAPLSESPDQPASPETSVDCIRGARALVVCGLARPAGFEAMLRAAGVLPIEVVALGDHARCDRALMLRLGERARELGAEMILTTGKDAVKWEALGAPPNSFAVGLAMGPREPDRWRAFLNLLLSRFALPPRDRARPGAASTQASNPGADPNGKVHAAS